MYHLSNNHIQQTRFVISFKHEGTKMPWYEAIASHSFSNTKYPQTMSM